MLTSFSPRSKWSDSVDLYSQLIIIIKIILISEFL